MTKKNYANNKPLSFRLPVMGTKSVNLLENEKGDLVKKILDTEKLLLKISFKNSHELRAPLANVLCIVNLLKERKDVFESEQLLIESLEKSVKKIDQVARELNRLLNS